MPLLAGKGHVGPNITEFRGGQSYQHTQDKFGHGRAEKQALAVALHQQDKGHGGKPDHHAAVAKMNAEHVHKLVQAAHAGQYGPEAQQTAQQAMQAPQGPAQPGMPMQSDQDGDEGQMPPARNMGAMFSPGNDHDGDEAPMPPPTRASMFHGGR